MRISTKAIMAEKKKKKKKKKAIERKVMPRIVVDLARSQQTGAVRTELFRLAGEYGWQIYDLAISNYYVPTNPTPSGAIISSWYGSPRNVHVGRVFDFPTVRLGTVGNKMSTQYPRVLLNSYAAGRLAIDYFNDAGFSNVVMFLRNPWDEASYAYVGAWDRARELGLVLHRYYLMELVGEKDFEKRLRWTQEVGDYVSMLPKPLAFFSDNDSWAAKFCYDCQSYGLSVPEDVAVLGANNVSYICETAPVPLSSIDMNAPLQIRKAMELLKAMLDGEPAPRKPVIIPPKGVVVRRSTDMLAVADPRVSRALRFMWDHLDWPIGVEDVCEEVNVSRRTLARLFRDNLGRGVNEELRRKRLEHCCELLLSTDMTIEMISRAIGFPSPPHLHRSFLKVYGMTPGTFRTKRGR